MATTMNECTRCGGQTSGRLCATCRGWEQSVRALTRTAADDRELLQLVDSGVRPIRIAEKRGVTRQAVGKRIRKARARQQRRAAIDGGRAWVEGLV